MSVGLTKASRDISRDAKSGVWWGYDIIAFVVAAAALVVLTDGAIHTASGDLALHYSFAKDIADNRVWPLGDKPWTTGMGPYPPLSHYLAAIVGEFFGSTFLGLINVGTLAVFACYWVIFRALAQRGFTAGISSIVLVAGACIGMGYSHASFGYEVFINFFYAHVVGEALFLAFVFALAPLRKTYFTLLVSVVIVFVLCWVYPQSAILAALGYLSAETLEILRAFMRTKRLDGQGLVRLIAAGVALPLAIAVHPSFRYMIHLAANDGALNLGAFQRFVPASAVLLIAMSLGFTLAVRDEGRWKRPTIFFAAAGMASGVVTLMQYAALVVLHSGSGYAVRKYAYLDFGLLLCMVAVAVTWRVHSRFDQDSDERSFIAAGPPIAALLTICLLPMSDTVSMQYFLVTRYQELKLLEKSPPDTIERTASRNDQLPWYLNYVLTLGDMHLESRRSYDAAISTFDSTAHWPEDFSVIDDRSDTAPLSCIVSRGEGTSLLVAKTSCLATAAPKIQVGTKVDLARWGAKPPYLGSGWSRYESAGVWSDQDRAEIAFSVLPEASRHLDLILDGTAFLLPGHMSQTMIIRTEPVGAEQKVIIDASNQANPIAVAIDVPPDGDVRIVLTFPDSVSPKSLGLSEEDTRKLGFYLKAFTVKAAAP